MISFNNDYSEVAHENILEKLKLISQEQNLGYGNDKYTKMAQDILQKHLQNSKVDIHFVVGGTQANLVCLSSFLKPFEAVIACQSGHINVHETGAIEATGHKIVTVKGVNGKILPQEIEEVVLYHNDEHMVKPRVVFISNATEFGTIYTLNELKELRAVCNRHHLYLYLDGARLGSALCAENNDVTLPLLTTLCDAFYIGGTKNGALFGEAIVLVNPDLKQDFRYHIKQKGALLAKGFLLAVQFIGLFEKQLFFDLAHHANLQAKKIRTALHQKNIVERYPSTTNQLFPTLSKDQYEKLAKKHTFSVWEIDQNNEYTVRFVTSWATKNADTDALIKDILAL